MFSRNLLNVLITFIIAIIFVGCTSEEDNTLTIATTTSIYNTGLLDIIEEDFESKYNLDIEYIVVGSGKAIDMARNGEADGIFVHSKDAEIELVEEGVSEGRNTIMYNYFEIVGKDKLKSTYFDGVLDEIRKDKTFVSRGDNSGTHVKELEMWDGKLPTNYIETGKGMLDTLIMTSELGGYTLTDDATFISYEDKLDLTVVYKNDEFFKNEYSYHLINKDLSKYINEDGAKAYLDYLQTDETKSLISTYGVEKYGKPLYYLSE